MYGTLPSGEAYEVDVQPIDEGRDRSIAATARVHDANDMRTIAEKTLTIKLARQVRDNHAAAAIAAFATQGSLPATPSVSVADTTTIRGNIRSKGSIQFGAIFALQYTGGTYVLGDIARDGSGSAGYLNYRARWGTAYPAQMLAEHGVVNSSGGLVLTNETLGPSSENPMGVYFHDGDVVLDDNVTISGSVVLTGNLVVIGTGVQIFALQQVTDPVNGIVVKTSFPAIVADKSIVFEPTADVVRISGLVLAGQDVYRLNDITTQLPTIPGRGHAWGKLKNLIDTHNHLLTIDAVPDPFGTSDGPAIYIKGAIIANRVQLDNQVNLPFALVFDAARTDTTDAPGFFTWRASAWTEGN